MLVTVAREIRKTLPFHVVVFQKFTLRLHFFLEILLIVIPPVSNTFSDWSKTCHVPWVKLTNSLGRTKLINSLGKQQHELSTST